MGHGVPAAPHRQATVIRDVPELRRKRETALGRIVTSEALDLVAVSVGARGAAPAMHIGASAYLPAPPACLRPLHSVPISC